MAGSLNVRAAHPPGSLGSCMCPSILDDMPERKPRTNGLRLPLMHLKGKQQHRVPILQDRRLSYMSTESISSQPALQNRPTPVGSPIWSCMGDCGFHIICISIDGSPQNSRLFATRLVAPTCKTTLLTAAMHPAVPSTCLYKLETEWLQSHPALCPQSDATVNICCSPNPHLRAHLLASVFTQPRVSALSCPACTSFGVQEGDTAITRGPGNGL
jgi:hypothetical protein